LGGYLDSLTLSEDGNSLNGKNQVGVIVTASRKSSEMMSIPSTNEIIGTWSWFTGETLGIKSDGTFSSEKNKGTWELINRSYRLYALHWDLGGYSDSLTLSEDGNSLNGKNQFGVIVTASRKSSEMMSIPSTNGIFVGSIAENKSRTNILAKPKFSLSKEALACTLPQIQRTYYVRVVPLDAKGNCTGLPSQEKEVIVGKPIIESAYAIDTSKPSLVPWLKINSNEDIKLAAAREAGRPHRTGDFCNQYYYDEKDDKYYEGSYGFPRNSLDWNGDLTRWFAWRSNLTNVTSAEWQVSIVPFKSTELANPTGLVAQGKLNIESADLKKIICGQDITGSPIVGSIFSEGSFPVHEFSIDFSKFSPAPDKNNPKNIDYYVRVVALVPNGPGRFVGYTSPTRTITYGPLYNVPSVASEVVPVTIACPDVKILSYEPEQYYQEGWDYLFLATTDMPPVDSGFLPQGCFWHKGEKLDTRSKDSSWWDDLTDIVGSIVSFFADVVNWISQAFEDIKGACASIISNAICFGDSGCVSVIGPLVSTGINTGLASMGIPPSLPNFNQLAEMGTDYLTKTLVAQAGIDPLVVDYAGQITSDVVKPGVEEFVKKSEYSDTNGLMPIPELQPHPAYMLIEIRNSQNEITLPGTLTISDVPNHCFAEKSVAIPPLQPGESMNVPVVLSRVPFHYYGLNELCYEDIDGNPSRSPLDDWAVCTAHWHVLSKKEETFNAEFSCNSEALQTIVEPIMADEESKGMSQVNGVVVALSPATENSVMQTYYLDYLYKGDYQDEKKITPNKPWTA
jgi:hypothetical protein